MPVVRCSKEVYEEIMKEHLKTGNPVTVVLDRWMSIVKESEGYSYGKTKQSIRPGKTKKKGRVQTGTKKRIVKGSGKTTTRKNNYDIKDIL